MKNSELLFKSKEDIDKYLKDNKEKISSTIEKVDEDKQKELSIIVQEKDKDGNLLRDENGEPIEETIVLKLS